MRESLIKLINILDENNKTISTMESCTGGCLAHNITNVEGAGDVFKFGAVTYSNEFKIKMGVNKEIIDKYTVYSKETAIEMAKAISKYTNSNYGVGITGMLNRADKFNENSKENDIVYFSIYDSENNKYINKHIDVEYKPRDKVKDDIVKSIVDELIKSIN